VLDHQATRRGFWPPVHAARRPDAAGPEKSGSRWWGTVRRSRSSTDPNAAFRPKASCPLGGPSHAGAMARSGSSAGRLHSRKAATASAPLLANLRTEYADAFPSCLRDAAGLGREPSAITGDCSRREAILSVGSGRLRLSCWSGLSQRVAGLRHRAGAFGLLDVRALSCRQHAATWAARRERSRPELRPDSLRA
jgi:hypothetical protein